LSGSVHQQGIGPGGRLTDVIFVGGHIAPRPVRLACIARLNAGLPRALDVDVGAGVIDGEASAVWIRATGHAPPPDFVRHRIHHLERASRARDVGDGQRQPVRRPGRFAAVGRCTQVVVGHVVEQDANDRTLLV